MRERLRVSLERTAQLEEELSQVQQEVSRSSPELVDLCHFTTLFEFEYVKVISDVLGKAHYYRTTLFK